MPNPGTRRAPRISGSKKYVDHRHTLFKFCASLTAGWRNYCLVKTGLLSVDFFPGLDPGKEKIRIVWLWRFASDNFFFFSVWSNGTNKQPHHHQPKSSKTERGVQYPVEDRSTQSCSPCTPWMDPFPIRIPRSRCGGRISSADFV